MDPSDSISYIAQLHSKSLKPRITLDDVNQNLPFFRITKDNGYNITMFNYEKHDNAGRMPFFCKYLMQHVLPNIDNTLDISGYYNIELHDTYSYLNNNFDYTNTLVWSKRKDDHNVVLIPDIYHIQGYGGKITGIKDKFAWNDKIDKIAFYGTTTGSLNPLVNTRIQTCIWAKQYPNDLDFYITNVAQIAPQKIINEIPNFSSICKPPIDPQNLYQYKYLLDIPGNTCSWDRVPLILNSKSILFKMPCQDMCYYYPLLHEGVHYIGCNKQNMLQKRQLCNANQGLTNFISMNANKFVQDFLQANHALMYLINFFECYGHLHSK